MRVEDSAISHRPSMRALMPVCEPFAEILISTPLFSPYKSASFEVSGSIVVEPKTLTAAESFFPHPVMELDAMSAVAIRSAVPFRYLIIVPL